MRSLRRLQTPTRSFVVESAGATDVGPVRETNEDTFYVEPVASARARQRGVLALVADGMGGHAAGEVASKLASSTVVNNYYGRPELPPAQALRQAVLDAHQAVLHYARQTPSAGGMGTTLTAALLLHRQVVVAHVGDSRAYLVRDEAIAQLTDDHSLVAEQVRAGRITPEQAQRHPQRNVILRALGQGEQVEVDLVEEPLQPGDVLVLCSDGVAGALQDDELGRVAVEGAPRQTSSRLVRRAIELGTQDNATAVVIRAGTSTVWSVPAFIRKNVRPVAAGVTAALALGGIFAFLPSSGPAETTAAPPTPSLTTTAAPTTAPTAQAVTQPATSAPGPQNVPSPIASPGSAVPLRVKVTGNLRSSPVDLDKRTILAELPTNATVLALCEARGSFFEEVDRWYQVEGPPPNRTLGWVHASVVVPPATELQRCPASSLTLPRPSAGASPAPSPSPMRTS